jgi:hypothetical protein
VSVWNCELEGPQAWTAEPGKREENGDVYRKLQYLFGS